MLKATASGILLSDFVPVRDIWKNDDESFGILFFEPEMKSILMKDDDFHNEFEARHGFRDYHNEVIVYIGTINLIEGFAHLYVPQVVGVIDG